MNLQINNSRAGPPKRLVSAKRESSVRRGGLFPKKVNAELKNTMVDLRNELSVNEQIIHECKHRALTLIARVCRKFDKAPLE